MAKREFYTVYIKPYLKKDDKPFNRQLFNDTVDMLNKNGLLKDYQVQNWGHPNNRFFK